MPMKHGIYWIQIMTNEEAEQLIAELKAGDKDVGCVLDFDNIEKIIKRFANKPLPSLNVSFSMSCTNGGIMRVYTDQDGVVVNVNYKPYDVRCNFTMDGFKQFTKGCNEILEYLNDA